MKKEKKEIDGTTYIVQQMGAIRATRVQGKLVRILGPGVSELKKGKLTKENAREKISKSILSLAQNFDDDTVVNLVISLFDKGVTYEHDDEKELKVSFDSHFAGEISKMWKVVGFVLSVNFGGALGKLKSSSLITKELDKIKKEL